MIRRVLTLAISGLDAAVTVAFAMATLGHDAEPATHGYDLIAGYAVIALFLVTAVPAAWLGWRERAPRLALALALCFPAVLLLLFFAAVAAFA